MRRVATTLVYARTSGGVVKVETGDPLPADTLPSEVERLIAVEAIAEVAGGDDGGQVGTAGGGDPVPAVSAVPAAADTGRKTGKGRQG